MSAAAVVYVHGLWLSGHEGVLLRRRLQRGRGWRWHTFRYSSTAAQMDDIADALHELIGSIAAPAVHLVAHSLGGIVVLRALERHADMPPGRVVFLGTPANASRAAAGLARWRYGERLLGLAAAQELLSLRPRRWTFDRDLGVIAGTQPLSLGRLIVRFDEPNDGTVAVTETRLAGATSHLTLPVSHSGMLLSARVAAEVGHFLANGRFSALR